ncbi:lysophospholipase L1-like esterase [Kribbella amoyensis]|uniref:Lysophospholipase L1-like esterase n=1 Tax=Kribbella amoyensis TaxID=996641 RepID=A0A561AZH7_9ACTN|nr:GDSL-type esterase/lipase family protein [Kribbella amoyensis]TWD72019.1 lysophospholipase L1-like esterase [Kribbella amoyensis]
MSEVAIGPLDRPELWHGALSWAPADGWSQPWRLPPALERRAYAPVLFEKAKAPAGVRAVLTTDARELTLELDSGADDSSPVDLLVDGELAQRASVGAGPNEFTFTLPGRPATIEVWLPQHGPARLGAVRLRDASGLPDAPPPPRFRWLCYGSSITQCRHAPGPTETWPALVARAQGWDLRCLGFGGQCHLDPVVAETLRDQPADLISLCLGINVYGNGSYSTRTWRGRVADFVARVRDGHAGTPIVVQSPIASPEREATTNRTGLTLAEVREEVHQVIRDLSADDPNLHLVDGSSILTVEEADQLADGLHPGPLGYRTMATRISTALESTLAFT